MHRRAVLGGGAAAGSALLGLSYAYSGSGSRDAGCEGAVARLRRRQTLGSTSTIPIACRDGTMVFPWSAPSRKENMKSLEEDKFDLLVIGGGCVGAGIALDAATRGLKVAIVEREDFAAGTSGRSTKLIHGGVRYLENAFKNLDYSQYLLVKEALAERKHMLTAAPYIARATPIMVPLEKWWTVPYYYVGTKVYDLVAGDSGVPSSMFFSKAQATYSFPMLNPDKLAGAIVYYDGQMNDTRYALLVLLTAAQAGATVANQVNVEQLIKNKETGDIQGAKVKDLQTGKEFNIRAHSVINATGPFSDAVRKMAYDENGEYVADKKEEGFNEIVVPAGGIHLVLPDHFCPSQMGLIVPETSDGRVLFFLPWEGGTLCGTTDSQTPLTMLPKATSDEVDFVLRESERYLNKRIRREDVLAAWCGIRPLIKDIHGKDTKAISREHVIEVNPGNMVTCGGGKWTTYRRMAQDAVDKLISVKPVLQTRSGPCVTEGMKLIGADRAGIVCEQKFDVVSVTLREDYGFDKDIAEHLTRNYGTRALQVAEIVKQGYANRQKNLHPKRLVSKYPILEAEVVFAVQHEYALSAVDVLARRTRLAFIDHDASVEALPNVITLMSKLLGWSRCKSKEETEKAMEFLDTMKCPERD